MAIQLLHLVDFTTDGTIIYDRVIDEFKDELEMCRYFAYDFEPISAICEENRYQKLIRVQQLTGTDYFCEDYGYQTSLGWQSAYRSYDGCPGCRSVDIYPIKEEEDEDDIDYAEE